MFGSNKKIMIIDDIPGNLKLLSNMLELHGYEIFPFTSGKQALLAAEKNPPDLILLDIKMPEMDGYQVCEKIKANKSLTNIPIIFLSALSEMTDKIKAFQVGGVDYITKPFQFDEVKIRVNTHLKISELQNELETHNKKLAELVNQQVKEISDAQISIIFAMAKLAEYRDNETGNHLERVQEFCKLLATQLYHNSPYAKLIDEKFITNIYHASPLHDIGKVAIPDHILLKPDKLTFDEFEIMKTHATIGASYLEEVLKKYPKNDFIRMGVEVAKSTHERWDGKGYPEGLSHEAIPLSARIMAVVDVYDAVRSKRCYKHAIDHDAACSIIAKETNTHFDPVISDAFVILNQEFAKIFKQMQ